jgi:hypothetical protein
VHRPDGILATPSKVTKNQLRTLEVQLNPHLSSLLLTTTEATPLDAVMCLVLTPLIAVELRYWFLNQFGVEVLVFVISKR